MSEHELMGNIAFFILIISTSIFVGIMLYDQKRRYSKKIKR